MSTPRLQWKAPDGRDGLLDVWEMSSGFTDIPSGKPINLTWMDKGALKGADPCVRNIFIEVDWMNLTNTAGQELHNHALRQDSLDLVGSAFAKAPIFASAPTGGTKNCSSIAPGIKAYFDVGNNYQTPLNQYVMKYDPALTEGGDVFNEKSAPTYCTSTPQNQHPESCVFPNQPGVISWKKGVHHIQKMHVDPAHPLTSKRYFSDYRFNLFHWALMGHALAMKGAKIADPQNGFPITYQANSTSGRADLPGGDFVVTVGLWRFTNPADAYKGSKILQASTFLHELAHNLWGFHGGVELKRNKANPRRVTQGLNCKPQQQSVLNYMYHATGVLDRDGNATVDLSGQKIEAAAENESGLLEQYGVGTSSTDPTETTYRLRWYASTAAVEKLLKLPGGSITATKAHCDGTALLKDPVTGLPTEAPMIRADRIAPPADVLKVINVDWSYSDGVTAAALPPTDLNFDGFKDEVSSDFNGVNDWQHIIDFHGLQQVSTRRSVFGLSAGVVASDLLHPGVAQNSSEADVSEADVSEADVSEADVSEADVSEADVSEADVSEADVSEADVSEPDPNRVDIDADTAGGSAPSALTAVVDKQLKAIVVRWEPPTAGMAIRYTLYRQTVGSTESPVSVVIDFTTTPSGVYVAPATTYTDTTVKNNVTYIYYVTAGFDSVPLDLIVDSTSGPSNIFQITN